MVTNVQLPEHIASGMATKQGRSQLRRRIHHRQPGDPHRAHAVSMRVCAQVLGERHGCLRKLLVWDVLLWCWWMREREMRAMLRYAGIVDLYRTVGRLTDRQLSRLCHVLSNPEIVR